MDSLVLLGDDYMIKYLSCEYRIENIFLVTISYYLLLLFLFCKWKSRRLNLQLVGTMSKVYSWKYAYIYYTDGSAFSNSFSLQNNIEYSSLKHYITNKLVNIGNWVIIFECYRLEICIQILWRGIELNNL